MQYTLICHSCENDHSYMIFFYIFLIFAQNIDCGHTRLNEAVLTSTHNLYFRAKIRKNVYPCKLQFYYIKRGCKGVYITRTCLHDANVNICSYENTFKSRVIIFRVKII